MVSISVLSHTIAKLSFKPNPIQKLPKSWKTGRIKFLFMLLATSSSRACRGQYIWEASKSFNNQRKKKIEANRKSASRAIEIELIIEIENRTEKQTEASNEFSVQPKALA